MVLFGYANTNTDTNTNRTSMTSKNYTSHGGQVGGEVVRGAGVVGWRGGWVGGHQNTTQSEDLKVLNIGKLL